MSWPGEPGEPGPPGEPIAHDPRVPFLYIEDHGPTNQVLTSGPLGTQFVWDPEQRQHIHRFKDCDDFRARAADIVRLERRWTIIPGLEEPPEDSGDPCEEPSAESQEPSVELVLVVAACQAIADGDPDLELEQLADFIADHPAVRSVAALAKAHADLKAKLQHACKQLSARVREGKAIVAESKAQEREGRATEKIAAAKQPKPQPKPNAPPQKPPPGPKQAPPVERHPIPRDRRK